MFYPADLRLYARIPTWYDNPKGQAQLPFGICNAHPLVSSSFFPSKNQKIKSYNCPPRDFSHEIDRIS